MKNLKDFDLYSHNTMRLHCIAKEVIIPETYEELINYLSSNSVNYILASGSNVILPPIIQNVVLLLSECCSGISVNSKFIICGSSEKIQKMINYGKQLQLGGLEFLYSVPCSVGGALYMNAGRGDKNLCIGNSVHWVECYNLYTHTIERLSQEDCNFSFRKSVFHDKKRVILRACFVMDILPACEIQRRIDERINYSKLYLDTNKPSCGSIFCIANSKIIKLLKGIRIGGACYSMKTNNWISNLGNAKYWQIVLLIYIAILLHKVLFRKYKIEVELWKK